MRIVTTTDAGRGDTILARRASPPSITNEKRAGRMYSPQNPKALKKNELTVAKKGAKTEYNRPSWTFENWSVRAD